MREQPEGITSTAGTTPTNPTPDPATAPRRRALRIGVLQDGRLVEERVIATAGEVLVGSDARCAIVLPPQPGVPRAQALFVEKQGRFTLVVPAGMVAELAFSPGAQPIALRGEPGVPRRQQLDDEARGRLQLGDVTLLFQMVKVAPPPRRVPLPPSLHDSLIRHLDWWMVGTAAASFAAHAVLMVVLHGYDPPRGPRPDEVPEHVIPAIWQHTTWPTAKPEPPTVAPSKGTGTSSHFPRHIVDVSHREYDDHFRRDEDHEAKARRVRALLAALIGANGADGSMRDVLRGGKAFDDADRALAEANTVAVAGPGITSAIRGGDLRSQTLGIPGIRGPQLGEVHTGERGDERTGGRAPRCPGGVCTPSEPEIPDTDCDPKPIIAKMRQYRGALVACYEKLRKHDPGAAGKVRLNLTISKAGRVTHAKVEPEGLDSDEISSCITASAQHWIFPELSCEEMSLSQVVVFTPSN